MFKAARSRLIVGALATPVPGAIVAKLSAVTVVEIESELRSEIVTGNERCLKL